MDQSDTDNPALEHVINDAIAAAFGPKRTMIPARVVSYDSTKQTITAQIVVRSFYLDEDNVMFSYLPKPIANIPVLFPAGDGFSITWPLAKDDAVTLVFADRSVDEWKHSGGADNTPQDMRRWNMSDAFALPGAQAPASPLPAGAVDDAALVLRAPMVKVGDSTATQFVALSPAVQSFIAAFITATFNTHIHSDPLSGTTGPPVVAGTAPSTTQFDALRLKTL